MLLNVTVKANRTVKERIHDKFLPSLNKGIPTKNIEFVKTPDPYTINEKAERKNFKRLSSAKRYNLNEYKAILRQNFNEHILIKDSKKSPRLNPNRSVVVNSDNEVETYDGTTLKAKDSKTSK
jgi:ribosomal protein L35